MLISNGILKGNSLLQAQGLMCERGDRVLFRNVEFSLEPGQLLYLKGPNGSGKTSLLRMVCGLVEPSEGEIRWQDEKINKLGEDFLKNLLYIGHLPGIKGDLTAVENVKISCALNGQHVEEEAIWKALKDVGLYGREDLPSQVLSQGQKRRVALARLLVSEAPLWVLDEPFVALDVAMVERLQQVIADHLAKQGMVLVTTHQQFSVAAGSQSELELGKKAA